MIMSIHHYHNDHEKKDIALGLLDVAIFLALIGHANYGLPIVQDDPLWTGQMGMDHGPVVSLPPYLHHSDHQLGERFPSLKLSAMENSLRDYRAIMEDAHRRLPFSLRNTSNENNSNTLPYFNRNITTLILSDDATSPIHMPNAQSFFEPRINFSADEHLEIFDIPMPLNTEVITDLVNSNSAEEVNNFDNSEDVRWRDYLAEWASNSSPSEHIEQSSCDSNSCILDFVDSSGVSESPNATVIRSSLSHNSTVELDISRAHFLHDHIYAAANPPVSQSSNTDDFTLAQLWDNESVADEDTAISPYQSRNDSDLMQQMYLQDVDLGFDWQATEPTKQIKDIEDTLKPPAQESVSYFVDGETGEHIPISSNNTITPTPVVNPLANQTQGTDTQSNFFNIEQYLDMFDAPLDGIQSQVQQTVDQNVVNVQNLTSLLDPGENGAAIAEPNENIWDDIATLSELTGMNFSVARNTEPVLGMQMQENNARLPSSPVPSSPNSTVIERNGIENSPVSYNGTNLAYTDDTVYDTQPSNVYEPQTLQAYGIPSPSYQVHSGVSPCFSNASTISEDGSNSRGSSPLRSGSVPDQSYLVNRFNNFNVAMETSEPLPVGGGPAGIEPGQLFFDGRQQTNVTSMLNDLMSMDSGIPLLENNMNDMYLNPSHAPFHPPPLQNASPVSIISFPEDTETHLQTFDAGALSETYESDSGVSMGQSPQRFSFASGPVVGEKIHSHGVVTTLGHLVEEIVTPNDGLDAIHHNHTYNGTVGAKAKTKKKLSKSLLPRESRDMRKARELNIPFTLDEIVMSPVEEYNEMLARTPLSHAQQALVKDIRRRGKNKVAAQNCRKRKIETISHMEEDVGSLRARKQMLLDEQEELEETKEDVQQKYNVLYQQIFRSLRDESGRPYDGSRFRLEQVEGAVILVPRVTRGNKSTMDSDLSEIDFHKVKIEKE